MLLHPKIQAIKERAAPINYGLTSINARGELSEAEGEERVIKGYLIIWGSKNDYDEKCIRGCCAKSIRERGPASNANYKITFLWQHDITDPLSLFRVLEEDEKGLYFETFPLDDVPNAERTIKQIRSGTINQFSYGFRYVWDKVEYDESDDSIILKEIDLFEGSVVTRGADKNTHAVRSAEGLADLFDETEDFINKLPRSMRLEARHIFATHKALINDSKPADYIEKPLDTRNEPPPSAGIDYDYLLQNFKN